MPALRITRIFAEMGADAATIGKISGPSSGTTRSSACLLSSRSHRNLPGESPAAQQEARVRYRILRHVLYAGTVANDIAQVLCRQVHRLFYFFLTAFRVSPEILGGRPERVRVCRPAVPSFRYRLCHLTPHDGAMPRRRAAPEPQAHSNRQKSKSNPKGTRRIQDSWKQRAPHPVLRGTGLGLEYERPFAAGSSAACGVLSMLLVFHGLSSRLP